MNAPDGAFLINSPINPQLAPGLTPDFLRGLFTCISSSSDQLLGPHPEFGVARFSGAVNGTIYLAQTLATTGTGRFQLY